MKVNCALCDKEIERPPYKVRRNDNHFCSKEHYWKWMEKEMKGENSPFYGKHHTKESIKKMKENKDYPSGKDHPEWKGGKITKTCNFCGERFEVYPYRGESAEYCSISCVKKDTTGEEHPKSKLKVTLECEECGAEFKVHSYRKSSAKFCSRECVMKHMRKNVFSFPPSEAELKFEEMCKKYNLPFKYVGDGSFWIENLNPDFIDCNGSKTAVEIFGDYWHDPSKRPIREQYTEEGRKKVFEEYGWKCIVIWEHELEDENTVLQKIRGDRRWAG